jgi:hypothetical protein
LDGADNHVDDVPVGGESAIGKGFLKGAGRVDVLEKGVVVAADLEFPRWVGVAEVEQVMKEASDG